MKKIIKFLPAMAILLASGLAVATTSKVSTPNVKWNPAASAWEPFSGDYNCDGETDLCVAHAERDSQGNIISLTDIQPGTFSQ